MESRLYDPASPPACITPDWYATRDRAPHLEQAPHQWRLHTAARLIAQAVTRFEILTVTDLGAGDGGLLALIAGLPITAWGYDLQPTNVAGAAERGVDVRYGDFLHDELRYGDLVVATEVLEHLENPHRLLRRLPARYLVASSPVNETVGSHYEHHLWAWDRDGYQQLLAQAGYRPVEHADNSQFQVILAERL